MEKINIAELLKDCPEGMELDCAMYETVTLNRVLDGLAYPSIRIETPDGLVLLNEYGCYSKNEHAKCIIFPKGKTTWEGFVPSAHPDMFEDGDIVATNSGQWIGITTGGIKYKCIPTYCVVKYNGKFEAYLHKKGTWGFDRLATEEEKQKLFKAINDNGYKWNSATKTLEKLDLKFHKGDWIMIDKPCQIISINDNGDYIVQYCDDTKTHLLSKYFCESYFHRWTIQDANDGDVLTINWYEGYDYWEKIIIFKKYRSIGVDGRVEGYGNTFKNGKLAFNCEEVPYYSKSWTSILQPATEEQRELLFQTIKENGYKWNSATKTLVKLIQPKFKVGDKVRHKNNHNVVFTITSIDIEEDSYGCGIATAFWFDNQDDYELVPNKFDINTLKPFESRVLVRDCNLHEWEGEIFTRYTNNSFNNCNFVTLGVRRWKQCIPYEGNEHLLGTTNDCNEYYKTWKKL